MGLAMTREFFFEDQNHAISFGAGGYQSVLPQRLVISSHVKVGVALSAAVALTAVTNHSEFFENVGQVTQIESATDMPRERVSLAVPPHLAEAYEEMALYQNLQAGWDGVDSVAPDSENIQLALEFLSALPSSSSAPEAGVTSDGYAEWYWSSGNGVATVSFFNGRMSYYARNETGKVMDTVSFDRRSIPADLKSFILAI